MAKLSMVVSSEYSFELYFEVERIADTIVTIVGVNKKQPKTKGGLKVLG